MLTGAPKKVVSAANRGKTKPAPDTAEQWPKTVWDDKDRAVLENYYGAQWKTVLTPHVGDLNSVPVVVGGDDTEFDFGDLNALDDEDAVVISASGSRKEDATETLDQKSDLYWKSNYFTQYSEMGVYPMDTLEDLKDKIAAETGVPQFRQHLFWFSDNPVSGEKEIQTSFKTYVNGIEREIDCRNLGGRDLMYISGVPIDQNLAKASARGDVFIESREQFTLIGGGEGGAGFSLPVFRVFVADLAEVVLSADFSKLAAAAADPMKMDFIFRGMVAKYWPMVSEDAAKMYFTGASPEELSDKYPLLAVDRGKQMETQKCILDTAYSRSVQTVRNNTSNRNLAVTAATVEVASTMPPGANVDIRNVFDNFEASREWPAALANFYIENTRQSVKVSKLHISATVGGNDDAAEIDRLMTRPQKKSTVSFYIRKNASLESPGWIKGRAELVHVLLRIDGSYAVQTLWPEDSRVAPEKIIEEVRDLVSPLIEFVNEMGLLAFPNGGELEIPEDSAVAKINGLDVSAFWQHPLSEAAFKILKSEWRSLETAGMVEVRGLQQSGGFTFQFLKGIVEDDPRAIERTVTISVVNTGGERRVVRDIADRTMNTYTRYTNAEIKQRWDQIYTGRTVRFYHRTVDLKVEMNGVSWDEMKRIWNVTMSFMDKLVRDKKISPSPVSSTRRTGLKALQESDPNLYDLRKADSRATVYSVLCQNPRPPSAYTIEEAESMPESRRKKLTQYWNFTEGRPAMYECPDKRFPYLSFLEGRHPLGYGLPCCQKTPAHKGSRRDQINRYFLAAFSEGEDAVDKSSIKQITDQSSRHTLSYGKKITVGRTATLNELADMLIETFSEDVPEEDRGNYRLLGIPQGIPAIPPKSYIKEGSPPGGSLFQSIAAAIGVQPELMGEAIAQAAASMPNYGQIAMGKVESMFSSALELSQEIYRTFALLGEDAELFTRFSPGGDAYEMWEDIVIELVEIVYGVEVVFFNDTTGSGESIVIPSKRIYGGRPGGRYVFVFKIGHPPTKRGGGGTYPLVFYRKKREAISGVFTDESAIVQGVKDMALKNSAGGVWNLDALACHLCRKSMRVSKLLVGTRGLCYAAIVHFEKHMVYVPVAYSKYYSGSRIDKLVVKGQNAIELQKGGGVVGPAAATVCFVKSLPKSRFFPVYALKHLDSFVGIGVSCPGAKILNFYHVPIKKRPPFKDLEEINLPEMPSEIDKILIEGQLSTEVPKLARIEFYKQTLYKQFVSEFGAHLYSLRNKTKRSKIEDSLFQSRPLNAISQLVSEADLKTIENILIKTPPKLSSEQRKTAVKKMLDSVSLELDREQIFSAVRSPGSQLEREIRGIMDSVVDKSPLDEIVAGLDSGGQISKPLPSSFSPCGDGSESLQCAGGRMTVPLEIYDDLISVLAADLRNSFAADSVRYAVSGTADSLSFKKRPSEVVEVRL